MNFYTPHIAGLITVILLSLIYFLLRRKLRSKISFLIPAIILVLTVVFTAGRIALSLRHEFYKSFIRPAHIIVHDSGSEVTVDTSFGYGPVVTFRGTDSAPKYAKAEDVSVVCELEFILAEPGKTVKAKLCELSDPDSYSEAYWKIFSGKAYCLLSEAPLYKNALYPLNEDFFAKMMEAIKEHL